MQKVAKIFVQEKITTKLVKAFSPVHLEVINESYRHKVPKGSETHFKIKIVSSSFDKLSLVERHKQIYSCLDEELKSGVHALAMECHGLEQWKLNGHFTNLNIPCMGKSELSKDINSKK